jgi:hypothetical protein
MKTIKMNNNLSFAVSRTHMCAVSMSIVSLHRNGHINFTSFFDRDKRVSEREKKLLYLNYFTFSSVFCLSRCLSRSFRCFHDEQQQSAQHSTHLYVPVYDNSINIFGDKFISLSLSRSLTRGRSTHKKLLFLSIQFRDLHN